jgi:hypothetical protein
MTSDSGAFGILADSGSIVNAAPGAGGPIVVTTSGQGTITTQGPEAHGIFASSTTDSVKVTATNVSTTGEFSTAINATSPGPAAAVKLPSVLTPTNLDAISVPVITGLGAAVTGGGNVTATISPGGSVMGRWQATPFSSSNPSAPGTTGPLYGLPAAGVILSSAGGTATLMNNGSIGALSDLAIVGDPQVTNNGTITGFTQFTGGGNSILNDGTFNLRHFADTTGLIDASGNGVRDTLRVAVADLGTGPNNTFTNNGTLALPAATGATKLDSTGQYLPVANTRLGNTSNSMALGGPLQGQMIGVATFTNSGVIDLQSNPVPGDVLVITGGRQAGLAPTHPTAGGGGPGTYTKGHSG